ncbi:NADPH-dependent aldehyde reductase 1 chloroplastic [Bienertia sinuspersici]
MNLELKEEETQVWKTSPASTDVSPGYDVHDTCEAKKPRNSCMFIRGGVRAIQVARSSNTTYSSLSGGYYYKTSLSYLGLNRVVVGGDLGREERCLKVRMASKFPAQRQETQPGKEHVMDPIPQACRQEYKPANKLQGKVALVTGGDSGIGRAVCQCFAMEGATVAFTYVKGQEDKDFQDTLHIINSNKTSDSKDPIAIPADLGYDDNCKRVVDEVVNAFGRIDVLVNNCAEQYECTTVEEIDEPRLERVFRTNIFSYFFLARHALKHMKEGASIINTTSVNAYKGNATLLDYTSTKGAIVSFTRGLALQLVQKGIRVNGVAPGPIWTPLIPSSFTEDKVESFGSQVPMNRAGQPSEVAPSFVFLACNADSSYITGQVLHPNGGTIGKVALVTGGDSGIGKAVCKCFAQEGATVAFTYVKGHEDKDAMDTLQLIKSAMGSGTKDPLAISTDLGYDENCKRVVAEVVNAFGRIDILVNNCAEQHEQTTIENIDEQQLERVFRTNIFSYFLLTRHALKHMQEGASIINTTSVVAYTGKATLLDYTSTKGAIVSFTRGLALQLVEKGIRVNGVAPGPIWTPLIPASFTEDEVEKFGSEVPMKRAAQPNEVAPSYVFLACNADSSYITGQTLHPNGGVIVNG